MNPSFNNPLKSPCQYVFLKMHFRVLILTDEASNTPNQIPETFLQKPLAGITAPNECVLALYVSWPSSSPWPPPKLLLWPAPRASCFAAQRFDIQRLSRPPLCCSHLYLPPSSASMTPSAERKRTLWFGLTFKFTWQTHSSAYWICMYECVFAYINVSHKWAVPKIICTDSFSIKCNY